MEERMSEETHGTGNGDWRHWGGGFVVGRSKRLDDGLKEMMR
jgi:hypothetical protein